MTSVRTINQPKFPHWPLCFSDTLRSYHAFSEKKTKLACYVAYVLSVAIPAKRTAKCGISAAAPRAHSTTTDSCPIRGHSTPAGRQASRIPKTEKRAHCITQTDGGYGGVSRPDEATPRELRLGLLCHRHLRTHGDAKLSARRSQGAPTAVQKKKRKDLAKFVTSMAKRKTTLSNNKR